MPQLFQDHFSGVANKYADFRPRYPSSLFDYLATLAPKESLVWDCACGNGQATIDLAQRFDCVLATDASQEQIAAACANPRIQYRTAPAEQSGMAEGTAGLITVAQALHWFDLNAFYGEANRVLRRGGYLAVWAYGINEVEGESVNKLVQDFYSNIVGPYWPPERKTVEAGYRTIPFPFHEIEPPAFRMEVTWTLAQLLGYFGTWSATSLYTKANKHDPLIPLAQRLMSAWGDPATPRMVVWPLSLRVGRK